MPKIFCIMQIRDMSQNLTHNPHNYWLILYQFFVFTQNLKQSPKKLWLVDFADIFWFILKLFLYLQQILFFYWYCQYLHWNLHIPFAFCITIFYLALQKDHWMFFIMPVPMQRLIIQTLWILQPVLL